MVTDFKKLAGKRPKGHVAAAIAGEIVPSKIGRRIRLGRLPALEDRGR